MDIDDKLQEYIGRIITGRQLNELLDGMPLLKFMNDNDTHYSMQYVTCHNLDILTFKGSGECSKGGLYVIMLTQFDMFYDHYGNYVRKVIIDPNALVYVENNKFKCDNIFLKERVEKDLALKYMFTEYIQYLIGYKSTEIAEKFILNVMNNNIFSLKFVEPKFLTHNNKSY